MYYKISLPYPGSHSTIGRIISVAQGVESFHVRPEDMKNQKHTSREMKPKQDLIHKSTITESEVWSSYSHMHFIQPNATVLYS